MTNTEKKYNLLIVEDHELTRFGLKTTFGDVDFIQNIYESISAEDAFSIVKNNRIDVIIMDLGFFIISTNVPGLMPSATPNITIANTTLRSVEPPLMVTSMASMLS